MSQSFVHRITLFASLTTFALMLTLMPALSTPSPPLSLAPSIANSTTSGIFLNWAGYTATGGYYTSITGTWTVPQVSSYGFAAADATWIGIGGGTNSDLIQSGTEDRINGSGQVQYLALFELLPSATHIIPVTIQSGDSITVVITGQSVNRWQIFFTDTTNGQTFRTKKFYQSASSAADWIEEAPANGNGFPLDNFGTVFFSGAYTVENGYRVSIAQSNAQSAIMVDSSGQALAVPSPFGSDGASFSITRTSAISNALFSI